LTLWSFDHYIFPEFLNGIHCTNTKGDISMKKSSKPIVLVAFCIFALLLTGCASGTKVTVTQEKYSPSFRAGDYSRYKGKKLVLSSFYNQAQNTKT